MRFPAFNFLFTVLSMLTFAATIYLVARRWTPSLFRPLPVALVCAGLLFSLPFRYAMYLNQTHMLIVFLSIAALMLAEAEWPVAAGFLLAFAAAVKITPGLLVVYWLVNRRWKAVFSMAAWSAVLWFATVAAVGHGLVDVYLANLHRISRVLLISGNNQSFAAWWMARFYNPDAVFDIDIYPLPDTLRLLSSALMLGFTAWGGWLDWQRRRRLGSEAAAPLGAIIALMAATLFAPIAWTHYSILLLLPCMLLADAGRAPQYRWAWAVLAAVVLLNYQPFASDIIHMDFRTLAVVRGQFFSGMLALGSLGTLAMLALRLRRGVPAAAAPVLEQPATLAA